MRGNLIFAIDKDDLVVFQDEVLRNIDMTVGKDVFILYCLKVFHLELTDHLFHNLCLHGVFIA